MSDQQRNQFDEVVELFVYAPVGLMYEYRTVLPQLVRRGRSQVQLARVFGEMAIKNRRSAVRQQIADQVKDRTRCSCGAEAATKDPLVVLGAAFARGITEFGSALGLAPPGGAGPPQTDGRPDTSTVTSEPAVNPEPAMNSEPAVNTAPESPDALEDLPLPIAGYENLPAREIIPLLSDLDSEMLARIRQYESATRARKTVLAKLDRLEK